MIQDCLKINLFSTPAFFKLGVARDFKFWIFRDYDDFGRKVAKYKINSKRRPFFLENTLILVRK